MSEIGLFLWSTAILIFGSYNVGNMIRKYKKREYFLCGLNFMCTLVPLIIIVLYWIDYILIN